MPKYLIQNISLTATLFPDHEVHFITDQKIKSQFPQNVSIYLPGKSKEAIELESLLNHDSKFRKNFWFSSLARYLYLGEHARTIDEKIVHIESDVILASDFPLSAFGEIKESLAYPLVSDGRGIGSVVFISGILGADILRDACLKYATENPTINDMEVLGRIFKDYKSDVYPLPVGLESEASQPMDGLIKNEQLPKIPISLKYDLGGFFDGNDYGPFLTGLDPRNHRGKIIKGHENLENFVRVRELNFIFDLRREFISIQSKREPQKSYRLFCLHIHSKQTKYFSSRSQSRELHKATAKHVSALSFKHFSVSTFMKISFLAILRRLKLIQQIINIKFFQQ